MTKLLVLLIVEVALVLLVLRAVFHVLGRNNPRFSRTARQYDRLLGVLLILLLGVTVVWPVVQLMLTRGHSG